MAQYLTLLFHIKFRFNSPTEPTKNEKDVMCEGDKDIKLIVLSTIIIFLSWSIVAAFRTKAPTYHSITFHHSPLPHFHQIGKVNESILGCQDSFTNYYVLFFKRTKFFFSIKQHKKKKKRIHHNNLWREGKKLISSLYITKMNM